MPMSQHVQAPATERCPDEIWFHIFAYACTDGGETGRSLSLVSSRFNEISGPVQLQSIAIREDRSLTALRALLENRPPTRRRVRHLLVEPSVTSSAKTSNTVYRIRGEAPPHAVAAARAEIVQAIIALIAPTLETFAYMTREWYDRASLGMPAVAFPVLRDLMLPAESFKCIFREGEQTSLPALCRLHLFHMSYHSDSVLGVVAAYAPHIRCLRISGPTQDHGIPIVLAALLGHSCTENDSNLYPPPLQSLPLLESLDDIIVEAEESIYTGKCGTGAMMHGQMVWALRRLDRATRDDERRVMFLPQSSPYQDQVREDWRNVVEGGDGCWATVLDDDGVRIASQRQAAGGCAKAQVDGGEASTSGVLVA